MSMTLEQLKQIRERCEKAAEGPWYVGYGEGKGGLSVVDDGKSAGMFPFECETFEAEFCAHARTDVPALLDEVERLTKWKDELLAGMTVNCVYCGYNYGPKHNTPTSMADVLKAHIATCPDHPLSEALKENQRLMSVNALLTQTIITDEAIMTRLNTELCDARLKIAEFIHGEGSSPATIPEER